MKKAFKGISVLLFLVGVFSCQREIPFDDIYPRNEVVVNGLFAQDSIWFVQLSWSRSILETNYYSYDEINNGNVIIKDEFGGSTGLINLGGGWYGSKELIPDTEVEYTIEVDVEGREMIGAQDRIPAKTPIAVIEHNSKNNFTEEQILFSVEFQDEPGEDYYYLEVVNKSQFGQYQDPYSIIAIAGNYQPIYPELFDQDYFYGRAFVTDEGVDGEMMRLDFIIDQYYDSGDLCIRLVHASRNAYLYNYAREVQEISEFNPFAQPAIMHDNIQNGFGIFGGISVTEIKYQIGG